MDLRRIHHVALICSDFEQAKRFYAGILGLRIVAEHYRAERQSHKLDLALPDGSQIELFSFPSPPDRPSYPEACGLRHLAFEVDDLEAWRERLASAKVLMEPIRVDPYTARRFFFCFDPDRLPIEFYETEHIPPAEPGNEAARPQAGSPGIGV